MLIESLIDISGMTNYKTPADKVLNAKDEKFETFRSATSEVDVLGRAYAGQNRVNLVLVLAFQKIMTQMLPI